MANTTLLDLPEELLLKICQKADAPALHALSVTSRRLGNIAQEALVGTAAFPVKNTLKLVELLQSKPGLCKAFTHMRLGALNFKNISELCSRLKPGTWEDAYEMLYNDYLKSETPDHENIMLPTEARLSVHLARAIGLSNGLKAMSMGTYSVDVVPLLAFCFNGTVPKNPRKMFDWYEQVRTDLQKQLEVLEIVPEHHLPNHNDEFDETAWASTKIKLAHFDRLTQLTVPLRMISRKEILLPGSTRPQYLYAHPLEVLPKSLEVIRLVNNGLLVGRVCDLSDISWITRLSMETSEFKKLRHIEIQFEWKPALTALFLSGICTDRTMATKMLGHLKAWKNGRKHGRIAITTTFKDNKPVRAGSKSFQSVFQYREGDLVAAFGRFA